jgi:hypothetical protein
MCNQHWLGTLVLCLVLAGPATSTADEAGTKGREILKKHQNAVVTVEVVLKSKVSMSGRGGRSSESRQELTGTVLDGSGLTVLSLSALDPGQLMQSLISSDDDSGFKMETELSDVKILTDDGAELAAEVVLRDQDMDLAFIRPKSKPAAAMAALDLSAPGTADVLDEVISLNRLGKAVGRSYAASIERISAIVQRPRRFYVPDSGVTTTSLGSPAFTLDGKPLGIFVMRATRDKSGGGMLGAQGANMTGIIVPLDDINKAMKQVPALQ